MTKTSRPRSRPTKTKEWPNKLNNVIICLNDTDEAYTFETDIRGRVRTYKNAWGGYTATVIKGEYDVIENRINVPKGTPIFECEIFSSGDTSVIGYPNEKVTFIVHL